MLKQKIYLSGGYKSNWQKKVIDNLKDNFIIFDPRKHNLSDYKEYYTWDVHFIKQCDIILAYMEESNPSGYGLSFELGYAKALNKTIILVDDKSDSNDAFRNYFNLIRASSDVEFKDLDSALSYLKLF
jgi:nucleoside 2-deoxyribosyltransferase